MPRVADKILITSALTRKVVNGAIERAAESHVEIAKQLAPIDTGFLRDNIHILRDHGLRVVSEAPYSVYVEFGTVDSSAQPFFIPAFESAMRQFRADIARATRALR